jgi:archaellum component FlaC
MTKAERKELLKEFVEAMDALIAPRFEQIDVRLDKMDGRMDGMDDRFDKMDQRFNTLEKRFDTLEDKVSANSADILTLKTDVLTAIDGVAHLIHKHFILEDHEKRISRLETNVAAINKTVFPIK